MKRKSLKFLVISGIVLLVIMVVILVFVIFFPISINIFQKDINSTTDKFFGGRSGGAGASSSWEDIDTPDMNLVSEREFIELDSGERVLVEKEYYLKFSGTTLDTWEWTDENGKFHREQIKYYIEWESAGVNTPIKLTEFEFHPTSLDERCPPPSENAKLVEHEFEGWLNDGMLWFRKRPVAHFEELPLEESGLYASYEKMLIILLPKVNHC